MNMKHVLLMCNLLMLASCSADVWGRDFDAFLTPVMSNNN